MKKILALLVLSLSTGIFVAGESAPDPCSAVNETAIRIHLPLKDFTIESKQRRHGLCEVILRVKGRLIPVYAGENFMIAGDLYVYQKKITAETIEVIKKKTFTAHVPLIEKSVAITYEPKKKSGRTIYFFTDPLCPYCHQAGEGIRKLADRYGVTLKVLLSSVHGQKGTDKSVEAVCRKFTFSRYNDLKWKTRKSEKKHLCQRGKELVASAEKISDSLGIEGVPAFYIDNGFFVSGGDIKKIEKELVRLLGPQEKK